MSSPPTFSIIVACKDPGPALELALESVWQQRGATAELIVIDGASRDGTAERLALVRHRITALRCESDAGVYDAMNKGVALARGSWVLFLGADDRLAHDTVLSDAERQLVDTEAAAGVGEIAYDDGRIYRLRARLNPLARNFAHHQGAFYRRSVFVENGAFDVRLRIMADYDFNLRLWKTGARFKALAVRVAVCGSGGMSDAGEWRGYREEITVRHRYFSPVRCLPWDALSLVRCARKKILRAVARK